MGRRLLGVFGILGDMAAAWMFVELFVFERFKSLFFESLKSFQDMASRLRCTCTYAVCVHTC